MDKLLMVILAKSYKSGGRCIAGKLVEYMPENKVRVGTWARPVSDDGTGHGSLETDMFTYEDGSEAKILDIVEIPIIGHNPIPGQPENYVIDESKNWKRRGSLRATSIRNIVDTTNDLWLEDDVPTNTVSAQYDANGMITQSLYLIKPTNILITLSNNFDDYNKTYKPRISAQFDYNSNRYANISVTCPVTRLVLKNKYPGEGEEPITMPLRKGDDYIICISLGPLFGVHNCHYKLATTFFDFDGYLQRKYAQ